MGAGSWGTTFAQVLCDAGTSTVLYSRRPAQAKAIAELHENPDYLPGITLTSSLDATADAADALDGADIVAFAVPAQSLRANLGGWAPLIPSGLPGRPITRHSSCSVALHWELNEDSTSQRSTASSV